MVINEDTGKGIKGGIMKLGFSQGSSVPVGPLFVFGEFAVEKLEAQKWERTEFLIGMKGFEDLGDVNKGLYEHGLWQT